MPEFIRPPTDTELEFFEKNPQTAGMAAADDMVVLNPFKILTSGERQAVIKNELVRIFLRKKQIPLAFDLTPDQQSRFGSYGTPDDIRATILGRLVSGDPSAGEATEQQRRQSDIVKGLMQRQFQILGLENKMKLQRRMLGGQQ